MSVESRVASDRVLLIDTNVFIASEEYDVNGEDKGREANEALRIAQALGYVIHVSTGTINDLKRSGGRLDQRSRQLSKYPVIRSDPLPDLWARAGFPPELDANDWCDLEILAALDCGRARWLLTEDRTLVERAQKAGISHVMTLSDFIKLNAPALESPESLPGVRDVSPGDVALDCEFFVSLFDSYPDFKQWWTGKVVPQDRTTLVIGSESDPLGLAVLKENDSAYGLPSSTAKICTFKISEHARKHHYGELLLDAVIRKLRSIPVLCAFVEVAPEHKYLIAWLEEFGFYKHKGNNAANGDLVLVKELSPSLSPTITAPWAHHKRFGPGAVSIRTAFLVPIKQDFHERLFPSDSPSHGQESLFYGCEWADLTREPCGNAIRKVYICNAGTKRIKQGDLLVFVVSETEQSVENIGVVESTLRSWDPIEVLEFAGDRTVYRPDEIQSLASHNRGALAIKFRRDRRLGEPWGHHLAGYHDLISSPVQSIRSVSEEGIAWLRKTLHS